MPFQSSLWVQTDVHFHSGKCFRVTINMKLIFTILTSGSFALGYRECLLQHQYILCFISELQCPSSALPVLKLLGHQVNIFQYTWQNKVGGMYFLVSKPHLQALQQKDEYKISPPEQEISGKPPTSKGKDLMCLLLCSKHVMKCFLVQSENLFMKPNIALWNSTLCVLILQPEWCSMRWTGRFMYQLFQASSSLNTALL